MIKKIGRSIICLFFLELYQVLLAVWECGGGTVLIYLLTAFLGISQHVAQGANLVFFVPTCVVAIIINLKNKNIDLKLARIITLMGIIGAVIGAKISVNMDVSHLRKYFGFFLILVAFYEIYSLIKSRKKIV